MINEYHNAVRKLLDLLKKRGNASQLILYCIGEDEVHDPTLVSFRVYGTRDFSPIVLLACGLSHAHELLPTGNVYLPTLQHIQYMRKKYGVI